MLPFIIVIDLIETINQFGNGLQPVGRNGHCGQRTIANAFWFEYGADAAQRPAFLQLFNGLNHLLFADSQTVADVLKRARRNGKPR